MDIRELPRLLFEEFGSNIRIYRIGDSHNEEMRIADDDSCILIWNDERFEKTILRVFKDINEFTDGYKPLIEIIAGGFSSEYFEAGKGNLYREAVQLNIANSRINLHHPSALLMGRLFTRAVEMTQSKAFEVGEYFDQERNEPIIEE